MTSYALPPGQGLYDPAHEHDACGIGFVANIKNNQSHAIIEQGLRILCNLRHRGAVGADPLAGDGSGILIQVPDAFLRAACGELGFALPAAGHFAVGMVFLPRDEGTRQLAIEAFARVVPEEGQTILGWRDVPIDNSVLGFSVKPIEPVIRQIFIGRGADCADVAAFERKLFVIRKRVHHAIWDRPDANPDDFYICSLSARTLVYKGISSPRTSRPTIRISTIRASSRRWRWCTSGSRPTRFHRGGWRIRSASSATTARSTRCAATSTGCWRAGTPCARS